jgi:ATP-dependent DNA ligase
VPDFDQLVSRRVDADVFALGFDLLALDGNDLRSQPHDARKGKLTKLLARSAPMPRCPWRFAASGAA